MGYAPGMLWVDTDGTAHMHWSRTGQATGLQDTWSSEALAWGQERRTKAGPALARHVDGVYAAWVAPDDVIYWSKLGNSPLSDLIDSVWSPPSSTGFHTYEKPALASYAGQLYLAWKDKVEQRIHWAVARGAGWGVEVGSDWLTDYGPALGSSLFAGLFMAWRGHGGDSQLYWTRGDGSAQGFYGPAHRYDGWTAASPALVGTLGHVYMAWRGTMTTGFNDPRLWWSRFDGGWSDQRPLDGWSVTGPALASDGQTVYLAYTEQHPTDGHGQLYWTHSLPDDPAVAWAGHQAIVNRRTYFTPAIA